MDATLGANEVFGFTHSLKAIMIVESVGIA
jgi:hypothetical protein